MERRKFLKTSILLAGGAVLGSAHLFGKSTTFPSVVLIKNGNPAEMVRKALDMLGGISRFISKN
ncbi:MAG: twin-arginine translocation signal domain-containing protein, partial [Candidatus Marinimicrobia bacterium]|nr:twin-arginine translocation signal domain-containing protein [Candidatus Neomarinimicrobiota bacterium]